MGQIYRYKEENGNVIYVGQVSGDDMDSLQNRINQHKNGDYWASAFSGKIERLMIPEKYRPLSKAGTDALETHFINKFYNENSKNRNWQVGKGLLSFVPPDIDDADWKEIPKRNRCAKGLTKTIPSILQPPFTKSKKYGLSNKIREFADKILFYEKCAEAFTYIVEHDVDVSPNPDKLDPRDKKYIRAEEWDMMIQRELLPKQMRETFLPNILYCEGDFISSFCRTLYNDVTCIRISDKIKTRNISKLINLLEDMIKDDANRSLTYCERLVKNYESVPERTEKAIAVCKSHCNASKT